MRQAAARCRFLLPLLVVLAIALLMGSCRRTDADIVRDFYAALCDRTYGCGKVMASLHGGENVAHEMYGPEEQDCRDYFCDEACIERFENGEVALASPAWAEACIEAIRHFPCYSYAREEIFGELWFPAEAGRIPGGCDQAMDLAP